MSKFEQRIRVRSRLCEKTDYDTFSFNQSEYSKQIVLQWVPGHCGVTGNEFADHLAKKGASIQQITRKVVPFTSAKRIIKKKLNDISSRQYAERNSNKIWWSNLNLPMWPRRKAVAEFRLTNGHDCLLKHLHKIYVAQAPFCTLCNFREDMVADHIRRCPALYGSSLCALYWPVSVLLVTTVCQCSGSLSNHLEKKSSVLESKYSSTAMWAPL
ncbi:RNase H domain-containing protein [Trichonephila clavipes]|nr:RNase H domain-containing protein [Trichonephila clavipes]